MLGGWLLCVPLRASSAVEVADERGTVGLGDGMVSAR